MGHANFSSFEHYLSRYGANEAALIAQFNWPRPFDHVVVIPAYAESPDFLTRLLPLCQKQNALLVLVINQPQTVSQCDNNEQLWSYLLDRAEAVQAKDNVHLFDWQNTGALVVDRFRADKKLPPRQGVGLARKIGCDLAAALIQRQIINSDWIHSTDADTILPPDYFQRPGSGIGSAVVYPFSHYGDANDTVTAATRLYEQSLHYYVDGLRWAGSPYAFHTIGSCLAVNAGDYCRARGFPKRAGGEDFYLLNKLAKLAPVTSLTGAPIRISARRSSRTPFGTGPAVEKILALSQLENFQSYHPQVFVELKDLLKTLSNWWQVRDCQQQWLDGLSEAGLSACQHLGIDQLFRHLLKQGRNQTMALQHIHAWFDAFRTLKFIHLLQDRYYRPLVFEEALQQATRLFATPAEEEVPHENLN